MAATTAPTRARHLAEMRADDGALVSVVIDLDPADTPTRADVAHRRNALLDGARREREGLEREGRARLDAAVDALARADLSPPDGARVRGVEAVADGEHVSRIWMSRPVADRVAVGPRAAVWEVAGHASRPASAIVLDVSRELGAAWRYDDGRVVDLFDAS